VGHRVVFAAKKALQKRQPKLALRSNSCQSWKKLLKIGPRVKGAKRVKVSRVALVSEDLVDSEEVRRTHKLQVRALEAVSEDLVDLATAEDLAEEEDLAAVVHQQMH